MVIEDPASYSIETTSPVVIESLIPADVTAVPSNVADPLTKTTENGSLVSGVWKVQDTSDPFSVVLVKGSATFDGTAVTSAGISDSITTGEVVSIE
jgi:hypothetical protein